MKPAGKSNNQPFDFNRLIIELKAADAGVKAALAEHKRRRQSVVIWKDGQVVELPPEDIPEPQD